MKRLFRIFIVETFSLYIASSIAYGLVFERGIETLLLAGAGLTIASLVVKPVINLLILPLNLITFNLFKWVSSALALYLVTLIIPGFKIITFKLMGFSTGIFDFPAVNFSGVLAFVGFSFIIALLSSFIYWLIRSD